MYSPATKKLYLCNMLPGIAYILVQHEIAKCLRNRLISALVCQGKKKQSCFYVRSHYLYCEWHKGQKEIFLLSVLNNFRKPYVVPEASMLFQLVGFF